MMAFRIKSRRTRAALACLLSAALLGGCATNTMTGRMQLSLVSEAGVAKQSISYYSAMVGDLNRKNKLIESGPTRQRIVDITNRLIEQAVLYHPESRDWDWRVVIIDEPGTVNAFCMPGGLMGIYTGFMEQLNATDDEIAQVMGHEIGHALAGHGAEKMSVQLASNIAVLVASAALANNNQEFQNNQALLTVGALAFVNLPNSRGAETEADRIGVELAARAGFDPAAAVTLWEKMNAKGGGSKLDFLSTHPSSANRADYMSELQPPMRELHMEAQATQTAPYDWLHADKAGRPVVDESKAIALYSPEWDRFKKGEAELVGDNTPAFLLKQNTLKSAYERGGWRDLAHHVMDLNFRLDLSYYYLGQAAKGLGFDAAASRYLTKAQELSQQSETACAKRRLVSCAGLDPSVASQ